MGARVIERQHQHDEDLKWNWNWMRGQISPQFHLFLEEPSYGGTHVTSHSTQMEKRQPYPRGCEPSPPAKFTFTM